MIKTLIKYGRSIYLSYRRNGYGRKKALRFAIRYTYRLLVDERVWADDPIHTWFELSYAQYLTIPRSVLQSMPLDWQAVFTHCLYELDEYDWRPKGNSCYRVHLWQLDDDGDWDYVIDDPLEDYERGRRRVYLRKLYDGLPD